MAKYPRRTTIHNYFPDGAIGDAALIDTENSYADGFIFVAGDGTEVLARDGAAVKMTTSGSGWTESLIINDGGDTFGLRTMPPGHYQIGITIDSDTSYWLVLSPHGPPAYGTPIRVFPKGISHPRYVIPIILEEEGPIGLDIYWDPRLHPGVTDLPATNIHVSQIMFTDGDASLFRDGASSGWSWDGTAHASASHGSQP